MNLEEIRERLSELDRQLLALVAERQRLSREVAEAKHAEGRATRDFSRERDVLMQARAAAASLGISPALAESVLRLLIRGSLTAQERIRVAAGGRGGGKTALVIGGTGKMGRWFSDFLASQGYSVTVADPAAVPKCVVCVLRGLARKRAGIRSDRGGHPAQDRQRRVAGTGGAQTARRGVRHRLAQNAAAPGHRALQGAGCKVTSVHPMFGPDTELLSGRHVIFIDMGSEGGDRRRARIVRFDDGAASRDGPGRARSSDRLRAGLVARVEHRVLHRARRRAAKRRRDSRNCPARRMTRRSMSRRAWPRKSRSVFRDPASQRLWPRIAAGAARAVEKIVAVGVDAATRHSSRP